MTEVFVHVLFVVVEEELMDSSVEVQIALWLMIHI